jgi:alkylated DNA repair dioxygenase AlkB
MAERPAGLAYEPDFVTPEEERELIDFLEHVAYEEVQFRGVVAKRVVKHYGVLYEYQARRASPGEPLPDELGRLKRRCDEWGGRDFVECLATRYTPGAGIGWHRDAPMFGSRVVGVSLGAACTLRFRRELKGKPREEFRLELEPRSVYMFGGAARWSWQHHIPPVDAVRYSVTFRTLRSDADRSS